jgi:hypothetical protein
VNPFNELFTIEPGKGIVARSQSGQSLRAMVVCACAIGAAGAFLYGYSMGITVSLTSAWKDGVKVVLVLAGAYLMTVLPLILMFKIVERSIETSLIALSTLMGWLMSSVVLGVTAPFCFLAGILWEEGGKLAQIIVVDIAVLVGLYMIGFNLYRNSDTIDKRKLAMPTALGMALILLAVFLLVGFFSPFLEETCYFSQGTERLVEVFGH